MTTIEHRTLGAANIEVPALGIGTAAWGDRRYGYDTAYTRDDLLRFTKPARLPGLISLIPRKVMAEACPSSS